MEHITYKGKRFRVKDRKLVLSNLGIRNISDIIGLEELTKLKELDLSQNQISEIKGLDNLNNLRVLLLGYNKVSEIKGLKYLNNLQHLGLMDNQISEIKGLENLKKLIELDLKRNPIPENLLIRLGAFYNGLGLLTIPDPQKFIDYCRPMQETIQKIKKMLKVSTRIRLDMMKETLRMDVDTFNDNIFDWAEKFGFTIDGDYVVINKDSVSDFIDSLDE